MNALAPMMDFRSSYAQLEPLERSFVDGFTGDVENIADKTGQRLKAVLASPWPYEMDARSKALLSRPLVRAAIAERIDTLSQLYDVSIYKTLKELTSIAYSNINNYITLAVDGSPEIDLSKATPEQMSAVKSFEIEDKPRGGRKVKFVLHEKIAALTLLSRHQGLLDDGGAQYQRALATEKPAKNSQLPIDADDDAAASLYAREINGN